jgi:hypothetical protein
MTSYILKTGQDWIAEPAHAPEAATTRELYTAWYFDIKHNPYRLGLVLGKFGSGSHLASQ